MLVPLFLNADGEPSVVLTRRREDLRRHPGEISFPGGRQDPEDADLCATALREAHEEIGLEPDGVELIGALQPTPTIATGYAVYPFVGLIEPGQTWRPQEAEVALVLELTLADLRAGYARRRLMRRGVPFRTDTYVVGRPPGVGRDRADARRPVRAAGPARRGLIGRQAPRPRGAARTPSTAASTAATQASSSSRDASRIACGISL